LDAARPSGVPQSNGFQPPKTNKQTNQNGQEIQTLIDLKTIAKSAPKVPRIVIHGPSGIGKTTFASNADKPIFILTEDGMGDIPAERIPFEMNEDGTIKRDVAISFGEVMEALKALGKQEHGYKTLVIDSLDWLEPLVWKSVCERNNVVSIEDVKGGYGKGYVDTLVEWSDFFGMITALRDYKGMTVIMIAHSQVTTINDPMLPSYDTTGLKLNKRAAGIATEYADIIGYACIKTVVTTDKGSGFDKDRNRALTTGERVLYLQPSPAYTAKNRYHMPPVIPLDWQEFAKVLPSKEK
jgi:hypothetical protein